MDKEYFKAIYVCLTIYTLLNINMYTNISYAADCYMHNVQRSNVVFHL